MTTFIIRRLIEVAPVIVLGSVLVFLILRMLPGDPAMVLAGPDATPEILQGLRTDLGLDQPLPVQYWVWVQHIARGDLGVSVQPNKMPVAQMLAYRLPATLELATAAMVFWLFIGVSTGIWAAMRVRSPADWLISAWNGLAVSVPGFWLGILAIMAFALALSWLPPGGRGDWGRDPLLALKYVLLPAITLSLASAASLSRLVRASMLDVLGEDYVRTARAKGLAERVVIARHAMRNALVPVITIAALHFGRLLSGAVIIESVFAWPGLGRLMLDSINGRDYAVVQAALLMLMLLYVVINLLTDIAYGFLDPRIRISGGGAK